MALTDILAILAFIGLIGVFYAKKKKKKDKKESVVETPKVTPTVPNIPSYPNATKIGSGFLWKPHSDTRGGVIAVLTPKAWDKRTLRLEKTDGKLISDNVEHVGGTNGDRETYFFTGIHAVNLPKPVVLCIDDEKYLVNDPTKRIG